MHRLILGVTDRNILVDHKDHNGLNNQRDNIRVATHSQNCINIVHHKKWSSKYNGVAWHRENKKWVAYISKNPKIYLGIYKTEEEAALAYNKKAVELYGDFANLNVL